MPTTAPLPTPEVSVVMPCLDEALTVGTCVRKALAAFRRLGVEGEVVVSDNGSTDGSQAIAREHGARVVDAPRRGYGAALMAGIEAARGRVIIMGDADDSYDWGEIGPFIEGVRGGADLVMGNRFEGGIMPGAMKPLHRYLGNPLLSLAARVAYRTDVGDFHCGMRAFTPEAYRRMRVRTPGMEFATEMVAGAVRSGLRIEEVPVTLHPDGRDRSPHLRSFRDGWRHLRLIASTAPDLLFLAPSLLALAAGAGLLALLATGPARIGGLHLGIHFLALGSLLALAGLVLLLFSATATLVLRRRYPEMRSRVADWLLGRFRLEAGLVAGGILAGAGLLADLAILGRWIAMSGGAMDATVHPSFVATTAVVAGLVIALGSFLLHLLVEEGRDP